MPPKNKTSEISEVIDYSAIPGFHVMQGETFLGTYPTAEDAQAFIDGHVNDAKIIEGVE